MRSYLYWLLIAPLILLGTIHANTMLAAWSNEKDLYWFEQESLVRKAIEHPAILSCDNAGDNETCWVTREAQVINFGPLNEKQRKLAKQLYRYYIVEEAGK